MKTYKQNQLIEQRVIDGSYFSEEEKRFRKQWRIAGECVQHSAGTATLVMQRKLAQMLWVFHRVACIWSLSVVILTHSDWALEEMGHGCMYYKCLCCSVIIWFEYFTIHGCNFLANFTAIATVLLCCIRQKVEEHLVLATYKYSSNVNVIEYGYILVS